MTAIVLTRLADFHDAVYRNVQAIKSDVDEFDDLTSDESAMAYAQY